MTYTIELGVGSEAVAFVSRIASKGMQDAVVRKYFFYIGLCLVSGTCETTALGCSTIRIIPFRGKIYVCVKLISKGCMTYRTLCSNDISAAGCQ